MGLTLLNMFSKSNFRMFKPKLLNNYFGLSKELRTTRCISSYLKKTPSDTIKVRNFYSYIIQIEVYKNI